MEEQLLQLYKIGINLWLIWTVPTATYLLVESGEVERIQALCEVVTNTQALLITLIASLGILKIAFAFAAFWPITCFLAAQYGWKPRAFAQRIIFNHSSE